MRKVPVLTDIPSMPDAGPVDGSARACASIPPWLASARPRAI